MFRLIASSALVAGLLTGLPGTALAGPAAPALSDVPGSCVARALPPHSGAGATVLARGNVTDCADDVSVELRILQYGRGGSPDIPIAATTGYGAGMSLATRGPCRDGGPVSSGQDRYYFGEVLINGRTVDTSPYVRADVIGCSN